MGLALRSLRAILEPIHCSHPSPFATQDPRTNLVQISHGVKVRRLEQRNARIESLMVRTLSSMLTMAQRGAERVNKIEKVKQGETINNTLKPRLSNVNNPNKICYNKSWFRHVLHTNLFVAAPAR